MPVQQHDRCKFWAYRSGVDPHAVRRSRRRKTDLLPDRSIAERWRIPPPKKSRRPLHRCAARARPACGASAGIGRRSGSYADPDPDLRRQPIFRQRGCVSPAFLVHRIGVPLFVTPVAPSGLQNAPAVTTFPPAAGVVVFGGAGVVVFGAAGLVVVRGATGVPGLPGTPPTATGGVVGAGATVGGGDGDGEGDGDAVGLDEDQDGDEPGVSSCAVPQPASRSTADAATAIRRAVMAPLLIWKRPP